MAVNDASSPDYLKIKVYISVCIFGVYPLSSKDSQADSSDGKSEL